MVGEGGSAALPATRSGFGMVLLSNRLPGTDVVHNLKPDGVNCRIELEALPIPAIIGARPRLLSCSFI